MHTTLLAELKITVSKMISFTFDPGWTARVKQSKSDFWISTLGFFFNKLLPTTGGSCFPIPIVWLNMLASVISIYCNTDSILPVCPKFQVLFLCPPFILSVSAKLLYQHIN